MKEILYIPSYIGGIEPYDIHIIDLLALNTTVLNSNDILWLKQNYDNQPNQGFLSLAPVDLQQDPSPSPIPTPSPILQTQPQMLPPKENGVQIHKQQADDPIDESSEWTPPSDTKRKKRRKEPDSKPKQTVRAVIEKQLALSQGILEKQRSESTLESLIQKQKSVLTIKDKAEDTRTQKNARAATRSRAKRKILNLKHEKNISQFITKCNTILQQDHKQLEDMGSKTQLFHTIEKCRKEITTLSTELSQIKKKKTKDKKYVSALSAKIYRAKRKLDLHERDFVKTLHKSLESILQSESTDQLDVGLDQGVWRRKRR